MHKGWNSYRDLEKFEQDCEVGEENEWHVAEIEIDHEVGFLTFKHRSIVKVLLAMFKKMSAVSGFAIEPEEWVVDGERRYSTPQNTDWMLMAWERVKKLGIVLAIILFSDQTNLSYNGRQSAHPFVMSMGNIPEWARWLEGGTELVGLLPNIPPDLKPEEKTRAFQQAADIFIEPLRRLSKLKGGTQAVVSHSQLVTVTLPHCYHPESCKVTCTMACNSFRPCSICLAEKPRLAEVEDPIVLRTVRDQGRLYKQMESATTKKKLSALRTTYSTHFVKSLLWDWEFAKTIWGNTYLAVTPDIMHIIEQGFWLHAMKCLVKKLTPSERKILLERYKLLKAITPASLLRLPQAWVYFTTTANFSASEHRAMMQILPLIIDLPERVHIRRAIVRIADWYKEFIRAEYHTDASLIRMETATVVMVKALVKAFPNQKSKWHIVKIHLLVHLPATIRARGLPQEYSSNTYEHSHKTTVKRPARGTNWKNVGDRIVKKHVQHAVVRQLSREVGGDKTYETAMKEACTVGRRVLTKTHKRMVVGDSTDPMWRSYVAVLGKPAMDEMASHLKLAGVKTQVLQVHTALAIPPHDRMEWTAKGQFVKASPSQRNFSDVAINPAGKGANWYGRCLVLFHYDKDGATKQAAYIEYYTEDRQVCHVTGCRRLLPTRGVDNYAIMDADCILSLVHVVPCCKDPDVRLLNRFVW
ncbi:hypothetical protein CLOP_g618 [Closterium sp. NIES-67]|nr:hypothetical protein CLOP_g618 [Closterium sp. NIES-67]